MSIPPLQVTGILPRGEHYGTIGEIVAAFPPTIARQQLHQVLQDVLPTLQALKVLAPVMIVYIDGSYVTSTPDPSDLDMLIRSDNLFDAGFKEDDVRALIWQTSAATRQFVDVFLDHCTTGSMLALFTQTRSRMVNGIIVLDF